jgi:hypothetical protein
LGTGVDPCRSKATPVHIEVARRQEPVSTLAKNNSMLGARNLMAHLLPPNLSSHCPRQGAKKERKHDQPEENASTQKALANLPGTGRR